ncbi:hypothetical protein D9615_006336 [Tricholomella constricta]|uniref:Las1-domain-containing protein n=1 Tax=Tricholomella constricta TaxID=117010 RepID=A0A8H5H5J5_9AGAR|nr:hypothetical protein D9615_006336 [Tricholomella constricta]
MRLPRRVPWASLSELEQLCSWIYTDENDVDAKVLAVNRLSAWRATTYLPHALESTLSILAVILQDNVQAAPSSHLSIRQSYSTAIIRLVNGLVDPLQLGAYARSIASIANQLGLPPWLVELRHAATHEDLPSIDLLREAARESMVWLLHNYFLPTINPSTAPDSSAPLRPLEPILKQYKNLRKITTRDASLLTQYKPAVLSIMKDIERWIAEARVAANMATRELGWEANASEAILDSGEIDPKERWALERLCDALLQKGGLVPLSKKKRDFPADNFSPPKLSKLLWTPLLQHLQSLHSDFFVILAGRILSILLAENDQTETRTESQPDPSYDMCLARWALWAIEAWEADDSQSEFDLRKDSTMTLMQSLGHAMNPSHRDRKSYVQFKSYILLHKLDSPSSATALLEALCSGVPQLETTLSTLKILSNNTPSSDWNQEDIAIMDQRLNTLLSSDFASNPSEPRPDLTAGSADSTTNEAIPGWRLLHESSCWRPCPIGVHHDPKPSA